MAKKIITASEIQKMKGYDANKTISANELLEMAANFFMKGEVSDSFCLVPVRFVERANAPECGYLDFLDTGKWEKMEHTPTIWDIVDNGKEGVVGYKEYKVLNNLPCVFVDEPYYKPALLTFTSIGGYRTERKLRRGLKWHNVYLV